MDELRPLCYVLYFFRDTMQPMRVYKALSHSPFFWLFFAFVVLELYASRLIPYVNAPTASEVSRNAFFRRGWPEYLSGRNPPSHKLVIIMSDSQGYAKEIAADKIYAALLQKRFAELALPVHVENWSIPGGSMTDFELLLLHVMKRKPDLLLVSKAALDFASDPSQLNLNFTNQDLHLTIGQPSLWTKLRYISVYRSITFNEFLQRLLMSYSNLARSRIHFLDKLATRLSKREQKLLIGNQRSGRHYVLVPPKGGFGNFPHVLESGFRYPLPITLKQTRGRIQSLPLFIEDLKKASTESGAKFIWFWNPIASELLTPEQQKSIRFFYAEGTKILEQSNIMPIDLRSFIPIERYLTLSHFDERGQEMMADKLFPIILDALQ